MRTKSSRNRDEKKVAKDTKAEIRKAQILRAAERVFAKKGFHDATISDIAKESELADKTIYDYFRSKEDLLFTIAEEAVSGSMKEFETHLQYIRGADNKIRAFILHLCLTYQRNPALAIVTLILRLNRRFLETEAYQVVRQGYQPILKIIEEGIASGELKPDINPYLVRSMIIGTIDNIAARSALLDHPKDLMEFVDPLVDLLLDGIRSQKEP